MRPNTESKPPLSQSGAFDKEPSRSVASLEQSRGKGTTIVQYAILAVVVLALIINIFSLIKVRQIYQIQMREGVSIGELCKKLTAHPDAKAFFGVAPLNVVRIDQNNLPNLKAKIHGLNTFSLGNYLIEYPDMIFLYNYAQDKIVDRLSPSQPKS